MRMNKKVLCQRKLCYKIILENRFQVISLIVYPWLGPNLKKWEATERENIQSILGKRNLKTCR